MYITLGNNDYPDYWTDFELLIPIYGKFIEASAIESTVEMDSFEDLKVH